MAVRRSFSPSLRASTNFHYHLQTTPPLSFQQYARSITPLPGAPHWQPSGIYHPRSFHSYLSPQTRKPPQVPVVQPWMYSYRRKYSIPNYSLKNFRDPKPKLPEPIWRPPGPIVDKRPTSLSPEKIPQKLVHEPTWHPVGPIQYKSTPYFDPPNLRWNLQQLLRSMPDLKSKPLLTSRCTSTIRKQT